MAGALTDIDPYAKALIRYKVGRLVGRYGFTEDDGLDLQQDLSLAVHISEGRYNAARGARTTFYNAVICNRLRSLIKHQKKERANRRREWSINHDAFRCDLAVVDRSQQQHLIDLKLDVQEALRTVPDDLRRFAIFLMEYSEAETARRMKLTRGQARYRREKLAVHFTRLGIFKEISS